MMWWATCGHIRIFSELCATQYWFVSRSNTYCILLNKMHVILSFRTIFTLAPWGFSSLLMLCFCSSSFWPQGGIASPPVSRRRWFTQIFWNKVSDRKGWQQEMSSHVWPAQSLTWHMFVGGKPANKSLPSCFLSFLCANPHVCVHHILGMLPNRWTTRHGMFIQRQPLFFFF